MISNFCLIFITLYHRWEYIVFNVFLDITWDSSLNSILIEFFDHISKVKHEVYSYHWTCN